MKINSCHFYYTKTTLIKKLFYFVIFFIASFNFKIAYSKSCTHYLIQKYQINFDDWDRSNDYNVYNNEIKSIQTENSVRRMVTLYNQFKNGYHERYDSYLETLTRNYPNLAYDFLSLRDAIQSFYQIEQSMVIKFKYEIFKFSVKKRKHYLQSLSLKKLVLNEDLLDALFGLDESNSSRQSWSSLIEVVETMDLQSAQIN